MVLQKKSQFLILVIFLIILQISSSSNLSQLKGVSRDDYNNFYKKNINQAAGTFTCLDGKKKIKLTQLNDNYCDCDDGSDEPGTSACSSVVQYETLNPTPAQQLPGPISATAPEKTFAVKFFCENKGFFPKKIHTSFVNDGVCDCCDGSDEYDGKVKCPNTCAELGKDLKEKNEKRLAIIQLALEKKKASILASKAEKEKLKKDIEQKEQELKDLKEKELKENAEKLKQELIEEGKRQELKAQKEEEARLEKEKREKEAQEKQPEQGEQPKDGETQPPAPKDGEVPPPPSIDKSQTEEQIETNRIEREVAEYKYEEAQRAREELDKTRTEERELENKIKELKESLEFKYGEHDEFFLLKGKCYTYDTREYVYELCPFDKATQKDKRYNTQTSLGNWKKEPNNYWFFENGATCWQGPARSTSVTLKCGDEEKILKVDEPSKCVYSMIFQTATACTQQDAEKKIRILKILKGDDN